MTGVFSKLRKFLQLDRASQALIIQAWLWLGVYRFSLRNRPLMSLLGNLNIPAPEASDSEWPAARLEQARNIGLAVSRAAGHTPWLSSCLVQSLVARRLLQKQGIPGTLFLGVQKAEGQAPGPMAAHSWLSCGPEVISSNSSHHQYRVIAQQQWC